MSNQDFSLMDDVVNKICNSLETEPENWEFGTWYITSPKHLGAIKIYIGATTCYTCVKSNKYSTKDEKVFSIAQGKKIGDSYYKALSITGSRKQQEIINSFSTKEQPVATSKPLTHKSTNCTLSWCLFIASLIYIIIK